ncbi:SAF domain-containing protein [Paratractidigestivibacter sp.]|uniref:SAF domain-containing protein n=1 Tax=Paratractidigestivibacter sp. TaxID=2847316 RepID=UPI004027C273
MNKRMRIAVSGGFAALTVVFCALYAQEVRADADRQRAEVLERFGGESVRLVVAVDGLEAGDVVSRQNVVEKDWVGDLAPKGALTSLGDAIDRKVTVPVDEGAPLTELNFRDEGEMPEVPAGYMAVQVPLSDKLGLPSSVATGSRLVAYEVGDDGTRLITGDIRTLVAAQSTGAVSRGAVSLAARPDDVSRILAASAEGSLRLAVPADDVSPEAGAEAPSEVMPEGPSEGGEKR